MLPVAGLLEQASAWFDAHPGLLDLVAADIGVGKRSVVPVRSAGF